MDRRPLSATSQRESQPIKLRFTAVAGCPFACGKSGHAGGLGVR